MKKILIVILLTLLLAGCQRKESLTVSDLPAKDITAVNSKDEYSDQQSDLVYHDNGTGVQLSSNSKLIISHLDLNLIDETAIICAVDLSDLKAIKLYDYQPKQDITYTPDSDGVYIIVAETSNGEIIDITPDAFIETILEENIGGFIYLH